MGLSVAVMQPYFFPYTGYYRLFKESDIFVLYDSVQFPRRGYVHRNRFRNAKKKLDWLTLPLKKSPQGTLIRDLEFVDQAQREFLTRTTKFPGLNKFLFGPSNNDLFTELKSSILNFDRSVTDYLYDTLVRTTELTGLNTCFEKASCINMKAGVSRSENIIEIVKQVGGTHYVNLQGGKQLYQVTAFRDAGISLEFLPAYEESIDSVLQILLESGTENLKRMILQ